MKHWHRIILILGIILVTLLPSFRQLSLAVENVDNPCWNCVAAIQTDDIGPGIFKGVDPLNYEVSFSNEPGVVRSRPVLIDFSSFQNPTSLKGTSVPSAGSIVLNLFEDTIIKALPDRGIDTLTGGCIWIGYVIGVPDSDVILATKEGFMEGRVVLPWTSYEIRHVGNGIHAVLESKQNRFLPEMQAILIDDEDVDIGEGLGHFNLEESTDGVTVIDVIVVYTEAASMARGSGVAMENLIYLALEQANSSYLNSGVNQRLNLVYSGAVPYPESGNIQTDLQRLNRPSDGYMDEVHSLRDTYCADIVVLISDNGGGYCGVSYQMSRVTPSFSGSAFAVVTDECAASNYSFQHELGHIMGARHDWHADSRDQSPFAYNHGYVSTTERWRTIMSLPTECSDLGISCTRLNYWSNPDADYNGVPMGVPEGNVLAADNRKTLNNTAYTVANFRQSCSTSTPFADFTADPVSGNAPLKVTFSNSSSGDIGSFSWSFGDGNTGVETNPVHTYQAAGIYTVSLEAIGPGGSDIKIRNGFIQVAESPSAPIPDDGIWRSGDDVLSFFLQKYQTGSAVVVITAGDGNYAAFLDPNYKDGIDCSDDVASQGYSLELVLDDQERGIIDAGLFGSTWTSIPVEMKYLSSEEATAPQAPEQGIWGDGDGVLNFYLQKYETGSCLVVITTGMADYTAFLDTNGADGISVSNDLDQQGYLFDLTLTDNNHGTLSATLPSTGAISTPVELRFSSSQ